MMQRITRALISVSDKTGIVEFADALAQRNVEILSTGGTAKQLRLHSIPVIEISDFTGFPEIMGGRVKTLHPKVHGGILARRGLDEQVMSENEIQAIDIVVVNLYPFTQTVAQPNCTLAEAVENIDIGGPTLLRAAAKNHAYVTVVTDPQDYPLIIQQLTEGDGVISAHQRFKLAQKAFQHTAEYDIAISTYLGLQSDKQKQASFPEIVNLQLHKQLDLRYGENPHQQAAFYRYLDAPHNSLANAVLLQGKPLSFNNLADADTALTCVNRFQDTACVIVKHANPCGVAIGSSALEAYKRAYATDPTSAFGGIIAFNRPLDKNCLDTILIRQFVEVIIAPGITQEAQEIMSRKKDVRVLCVGTSDQTGSEWDIRSISGGLLIQSQDQLAESNIDFKTVTQRTPTGEEIQDLKFAWQVAQYVKSNAIVYAKGNQTLGIGAGQMSRVYSARIGVMKAEDAGFNLIGSVLASDAFFPFRDTVDAAVAVGVTAIIQPGGSIRDAEVIEAANSADIAMVFTGIRHFRH